MSEYFRDDQGAAPERFLTARELAAILGVHENYIYDHAARGLIPSYKIGGNRRFRWSEIEHWLDLQRTTAYAHLNLAPGSS